MSQTTQHPILKTEAYLDSSHPDEIEQMIIGMPTIEMTPEEWDKFASGILHENQTQMFRLMILKVMRPLERDAFQQTGYALIDLAHGRMEDAEEWHHLYPHWNQRLGLSLWGN